MFHILVVEDDRELNKTVCTFLKQNGYEAVGCLSANEAYDAGNRRVRICQNRAGGQSGDSHSVYDSPG